MKNLVGKLLVGRSAKFNVLLVLCLFAFVGLGCFGSGKGKDAKPIPAAFLGDWQGQDGSTLSIRADGTGDYRSGGKKVEGGTAEVSEADKTISITFFGIGETLKIDSPPQGDTMKLNGVTYKRKGGFSVADTNSSSDNKSENSNKKEPTSTKKVNAAKYEVPEDEQMQDMTRTALNDFNDAVQEGDFTDFHSTISKTWQKQTTPAKFNEVFSEFMTKKVNISGVNNRDADFSPAPSVEMDGGAKKLIAKGCYDVSPRPVGFTLKWIPEGKEWKLFGIEVDTTISSC
ncbi:MAG TPA: hypothetical protein VGB00_00215 [Pyrinomonadaceae bacterium]|jgi:hypothetical protein